MKTAKEWIEQPWDDISDSAELIRRVQLDILQSLRSRLTDPASIAVVDKMIEEVEAP